MRVRRRLTSIVSAILILGTSLAPPAMALMAARGSAPAGHHHHSEQGAPGHSSSNSCCDVCWTGCATAPGVPLGQTLASPTVVACLASCPKLVGLSTSLPVEHRLPFPQGPPPLLV